MSSWMEILECPKPEEHVVQLYGSDSHLLARNVSRYLADGLKQDDALLVIATPEHNDAILQHLEEEECDPAGARDRGQLICLDARATLAQFMVDGQPDRKLFAGIVGRVLEQAREQARSGKIRAFGEMVAVLWTEGHAQAATRLEECWNELLKGNVFSLFCAYPIDIFVDDLPTETLGKVLGAHTHLLAGPQTLLSSARAAR